MPVTVQNIIKLFRSQPTLISYPSTDLFSLVKHISALGKINFWGKINIHVCHIKLIMVQPTLVLFSLASHFLPTLSVQGLV
jgi:hypothetical protein